MKSSIVAAFLMCSGSEFQTEDRLVLIEWNFEEAGVSTGTERSRRRIQI